MMSIPFRSTAAMDYAKQLRNSASFLSSLSGCGLAAAMQQQQQQQHHSNFGPDIGGAHGMTMGLLMIYGMMDFVLNHNYQTLLEMRLLLELALLDVL